MVATPAPKCFCGRKAASFYKSRHEGYLILLHKLPNTQAHSNAHCSVWVCCDDCRLQALFPMRDAEITSVLDFMVARHALTRVREATGSTTTLSWSKAKAEVSKAACGAGCVDVLQWAYSSHYQNIYSIIPSRDPCPRIFDQWLAHTATRHDLINLYQGIQLFTLCTNCSVAQLLKDGKLAMGRSITRTEFGIMFCADALTSSTRRGNLPTDEKVEAMWKFRISIQKAAAPRHP